MEKYITLSLGGLSFIDSLNFLKGSLDSLVSTTLKEALKMTSTVAKGSDLLYKKGDGRDSPRQGFRTKKSFTAS